MFLCMLEKIIQCYKKYEKKNKIWYWKMGKLVIFGTAYTRTYKTKKQKIYNYNSITHLLKIFFLIKVENTLTITFYQ